MIFAGDIVLISKQVKQAHTLLDRVETAAAAIGLMANPKKTKVMTFNCPSNLFIILNLNCIFRKSPRIREIRQSTNSDVFVVYETARTKNLSFFTVSYIKKKH